MIKLNKIYCMDCLKGMKIIDNKSIDMILCDLPYGITACEWDIQIPLDKLWKEYKRIIKDNGAIVLTSTQPFTTDLINSNRKWFRYELIWNKMRGMDFIMCNKKPLKSHENIVVFYKNLPVYNPQMTNRKNLLDSRKWKQDKMKESQHKKFNFEPTNKKIYTKKYPLSVLEFSIDKGETNNEVRVHPTQKPVELFKYLIKMYTNEGDLVLDNCIGSGTTAIACRQTGRNFIGFEINPEYCKIAEERLKQQTLF
ncbi:MAG: DNA-methyltransferase [Candidatus Heimdallarchaeaceae archaeon]